MGTLVSSTTGMVHLWASILAMIAGTYILWARKGTKTHRQVGCIYVLAMLVVNLTAFLIYRLFGKFAIFHWFAVVSLVTLLGGMLPILLKRGKGYVVTHFSFMYWSVIGLYAAFVSEVFTRLPALYETDLRMTKSLFFILLNIAIVLVMGAGAYFFVKYKDGWQAQFDRNK